MICPNCGKEIPSNAKFCPICGSVICDQQQMPKQDAIGILDVGNMRQQRKTNPRKFHGLKMTRGIVLIFVVVAAIFIVRAVNEHKMLAGLPQAIFSESEEIIQLFYDDYLDGRNNRMIGYKADDFRFEKGAKPNTFNLYGVIEVTDMTAQERPVYRVGLNGTITTDFFRRDTSVTWDFNYEIPEPRITYDTIAGYYVAGPTNSYIYPELGISIEGSALNIWESTYGGGDGSFEVTFESNWPKIERNSFKFSAEEVYWDETYNLTLEFIPALESTNGVDTIYLKGSERFDDYAFYRVETLYEDDNEYTDPGSGPTLFTDMKELGRAFLNNALSAESVYGGQCIAVTGTVYSVSTSGTAVTVQLRYDDYYRNEYHWYDAYFKFDESNTNALYSISKGQTVTIAGYFDEAWGTSLIYFKDCYLLN